MKQRAFTVEEALLWQTYTQGIDLTPRTGASQPFVGHPPSPCRPAAASGARIDLHGLTIEQASRMVRSTLEDSTTPRSITFITGLSGSICREFPLWMDNHPRVHRIEPLHGGGAFRVVLHKASRTQHAR